MTTEAPQAFTFYEDQDFDREIDSIFEKCFETKRTARGIGLCNNVHCEKYLKSNFLLAHLGDFTCPECKQVGSIVAERGIPSRELGQLFGEVRVEFNYDPTQKRYREIAVLRDESLGPDVGSYTAQMPTVNTEKRALKLGEMLFASLNEGLSLDSDLEEIPKARERVLNFDSSLEEFKEQLRGLEISLRDNPFYQNTGVVSGSSVEEITLKEGDAVGPQSLPPRGTPDEGPRVHPHRTEGRGALHVHHSGEPRRTERDRPQGRLRSLFSLGRER